MTTPLCRLLPALAAWWAAAGVVRAVYDESMTCGSGSERYGRQYRFNPELPCDLSKDGWCTDPGNQYPWGSMRRFVYENQGLMKRMYGNRRHYNVLRTELINEMYDDMYEEMPKRQHYKYRPSAPRDPSQAYPTYRSQKPGKTNTPRQRTNTDKERGPRWMKAPEHEHERSPSRTRDKINKAGESWEGEGALGTTVSEGPEPTVVPPGYRDVDEEEGGELWATTFSDSPTDSSSSSYSTPISEDETDSTYTSLAETTQAPATVRSDVSLGGEGDSEDDYTSDTFIPTPLDEDDLTTLTFRERIDQVTKNDFEKQSYDKDEIDLGIEKAMSEEQGVAEMEGFKGEAERERGDEVRTNDKISVIVDGEVIAESELKPENREQVGEGPEIDSPSQSTRPSGHIQQQLNQQQLNQQQLNQQQLNQQQLNQQQAEAAGVRRPIRGVNACPVKEEFVAPYWANNTRGETLALLNLYPFEQYVQWERCTNENRQMYCRKGCRCEQQYRLHKLLAFDPNNECRGIFSDWFRFPSCCVCKCYDLPQDVFTSRRPRLHEDEYDEYGDEEEEESDMFDDEEELDDEELLIYETEEEEEGYEEEDEEPIQNEATPRVSVKIPPQRRPRLPPRPQSHIIPPSHNLLPPPLPPAPPLPPLSSPLEERERGSTDPPEVSTLGTVDVATPHYYYNVSNLARVLYANAGMHPLSRAPRNSPEE